MHGNITCRLIPGTPERPRRLASTAGACRYVWNREAMQAWREVAGEKPAVSFYSPGKRFTQRRRETPRLQELPFAPMRCTLKRQADAWQRAFAGGGFPRFRSRRGDHSITLPTGTVRLRGGKLHFPKFGPMVLRRHGGAHARRHRRDGRRRVPAHEGNDGEREGHGRGAGMQRSPEGGAQPGHHRHLVGRPSAQPPVQGHGIRRVRFAALSSMRHRERREPTYPTPVRVRVVRTREQRGHLVCLPGVFRGVRRNRQVLLTR